MTWLRWLSPPMEPTCSPEEIAQATVAALRRRDHIERERAMRMAEYERTWLARWKGQEPCNVVRFWKAVSL